VMHAVVDVLRGIVRALEESELQWSQEWRHIRRTVDRKLTGRRSIADQSLSVAWKMESDQGATI
jgi:hypothetical protein